MNRSDRDPDAYDAMRDDMLTEQKPRIATVDSLPPCMAPDGAAPCDVYHAQAARIAALEAQLAEAVAELREVENALWAGVGDEKFSTAKRINFLLREAGEKRQMQAQLAAAQERERAARKLAGQWVSSYLGLLIDQIEQPENEWMLEMLRPTLTQVADALAAAQPASDGQEGK